ncbi:MAG TPA: hypothetical protein DCL54_15030, partial [Alphaproteobacteria bacterium]|nr:hypothetical protein [Alphaproteobacteria bacterium]
AYVDSDANASCDTEVQALFGQQKAPKLCKSMSSWAPVAMFVDWDLNAQAGLDMLVKKMMRER